jgi:polysaccharide export outer membrane protein
MRAFSFCLISCLLPLLGCASNRPTLGGGGTMYETQELGKFVEDTAGEEGTEHYIIGVGDVLDVVFFFHTDLTTRDLIVRSDGRITLPYLGDVKAAGVTPMELDSTLTTSFLEILREPNLSVIVRRQHKQTAYVFGQVTHPGGIVFDDRLSLLQAVASAGGLTKGAKANHTLLIRRDGSSKVVGIEVDLKAIINGEAIQNDLWLNDYDIVYVPKTRIQTVSEFAVVLNDLLGGPTNLVLRGWQVKVTQEQLELLRDDIRQQ